MANELRLEKSSGRAVPATILCDPTVDDDHKDVSDVLRSSGEAAASSASSREAVAASKWYQPRINVFRVAAAIFSFLVLGMNDAAYGALIPYLEVYYKVNYTIISIVFLAPFVGYIIAAFTNDFVHHRFGQLGVAFIAPLAKIVAYVVICNHPPYAVLPIIYVLCGFGNGLEDGGWNAWIGNMDSANQLMGFLHGAYGLGATISPLTATAMVTKGNLPWYYFYYLMIGMAACEWLFCLLAFRTANGAAYQSANVATNADTNCEKPNSSTTDALRDPITWLTALLLFIYTGVEIGVGGWLPTFMINVRHGGNFQSGMAVVGYWLGLTVGRLVLGFITGRLGEKVAVSIYLVLAMALELCFWLIPSFVSSAIFAAFLGFFLGPIFPAAIVVATKLLPQRLHVSAIGFAAASGSGGGSVLPFAIGAISEAKGVWVLQPILLSFIVVTLVLWLVLSGGFKKKAGR